jgi:hypothetical protein
VSIRSIRYAPSGSITLSKDPFRYGPAQLTPRATLVTMRKRKIQIQSFLN